MILFILAYLGGVLTILSPCILPVLPFIFARADKPFLKSGLPLLVGMAVTFAGVASLAAIGGGWVVAANQYGRYVAMVVLAFFGLLLIFPALSERATRPLVALGNRLSQPGRDNSFWGSLLLGAATGLLWAPCAGPILGLILTGAALQGASVATSLLLLAYALGAATSLALALLVGGKLFAAMKRSLGAGEWVRRALGVLVLAGVGAIALGLDTGLLTRLSLAGTSSLEQSILERLGEGEETKSSAMGADGMLPDEGPFPSLAGANQWMNSPPLTNEQLKGKVVLIDFWTYSCINCLRTIPYVRAWAEKYKDAGLVVIGVHTPEFAFERDPANVRQAIADLGITYPVALDNERAIWRGFNNRYWPAHYFIDGKGRIRYHHFGEGNYARSEKVIQRLLAENGNAVGDIDIAAVKLEGTGVSANRKDRKSVETYIGYARAKEFASPGGFVRDRAHDYPAPSLSALNRWGLAGNWTVDAEHAVSGKPGAKIAFRFHARDLHLVLGSSGKPVRFRVTIDGKVPGGNHGLDIDANGIGTVTNQRLYQLVRQKGPVRERIFEIEFLSPGVQAFAFTFG